MTTGIDKSFSMDEMNRRIKQARRAGWNAAIRRASKIAEKKPGKHEVFDHGTGKIIAICIRALIKK